MVAQKGKNRIRSLIFEMAFLKINAERHPKFAKKIDFQNQTPDDSIKVSRVIQLIRVIRIIRVIRVIR